MKKIFKLITFLIYLLIAGLILFMLIPKDDMDITLKSGKDYISINEKLEKVEWENYFENNNDLIIKADNIDLSKSGEYELLAKYPEDNEYSKILVWVDIPKEIPKVLKEESIPDKEESKTDETKTVKTDITNEVKEVEVQPVHMFQEKIVQQLIINKPKPVDRGVWKQYLGTSKTEFNAAAFGKYSEEAREVYDNLSEGMAKQGTIKYDNEEDLRKYTEIMEKTYGFDLAMISYVSNADTCRGYYSYVQQDQDYCIETASKVAYQIIGNGGYEKDIVKKVCEWIANNITYDVNQGQEAVLFKTKKGNCNAMSKAAIRILKNYGIYCWQVPGNAGGEKHGWVSLTLADGVSYYCDPTWYATGDREEKYVLSQKLWNTHIAWK